MHYNQLNEYMNCKMSAKTPVVGMVATMFCGSDRYAMVVTEVMTDKMIRLTHMSDTDYVAEKIVNPDGTESIPSYKIGTYGTLSEDGKTIVSSGEIYTMRKNGRWMPKGRGLWETGSVHLGTAENYRDPSF